MVPLRGSTVALRRHFRTFDSEKGGMAMLRALFISLALLTTAAALAYGGGHRGMGDGGLRNSAGVVFVMADGLAGFGDGGLALDGDGSAGMGDGGLRGMGDGGL